MLSVSRILLYSKEGGIRMKLAPSCRKVAGKPVSFTIALLFLLCSLSSPGSAQRHSHMAAAISLTATVSPSITMTVSPSAEVSPAGLLPVPAGRGNPVAVSARWVLGPGNISVAVLSSGNPLLGNEAISRVPVALLSPLFPLLPSPDPVQAHSFLAAARAHVPASQLELRIDTGDLRLPAGSEDGVLTIRAQAF
jgi:hypothetical protein